MSAQPPTPGNGSPLPPGKIITLENLKADEANMIAQINQLQGILNYIRQLQVFMQQAEPAAEPPPTDV